tara:strand:+ start:283 stop:522 length:240 start_codon:yes stop_codon:yes gene_type:complete
MTDIIIPPAALEAGARALARYNCEKWDNDPDRWRAYFTDEARAACMAMLQAWPRMYRTDSTLFSPALILPLTEKTDDKT